MVAYLAAEVLVLTLATASEPAGSRPLKDILTALAREAGTELTFLGPPPSTAVTPPRGRDLEALTGLLDRLGLSYAFSTDSSGATRLVVVTGGLTPPSTAVAAGPSTPSDAAQPAGSAGAPADPAGGAKLPPGFVASPELVLSDDGSGEGSSAEGFRWSPAQAFDADAESELPIGFVSTPPQVGDPPGQPTSTP